MRNLKKLLALTLAMVMAFSLMLTANAAVKYDDYTDKDSITDEFTEAVQVLTGLEVMQGDEKGFRPSDKITRAEAAAVIYRAVTGDVTNKQNDLYKDYGTFTDVKSDDWFAGYVGYCQNAGYIKGTSPTTFNPYGQVTGYEVLAMILRAVGYGKNNEFTGSSWQVNVAALARQLGVTRNVTAAHMEQTLNMAAPREVVADLVFMTIATVPTVTYTPALAYNDKQSIAGSDSTYYNITLGQQVFGLYHADTWQVIDNWGNPGYRWYKNGSWDGKTVTGIKNGKGYMVPANHPVYTASASVRGTVATIAQAPDYEITKQVLECDVAAALEEKGLDFDEEQLFNLYVNQNTVLTNSYRVVAVDTVTKVGGQGRLTKVYFDMKNDWFTDDDNNHDNVVTMVDTYLARVNNVIEAKLDPAGHVITPAQMEVTIYDGPNKTWANAVDNTKLSNRIITKGSTDATNWDYSKGDMILLNAYTSKANNVPTGNRDHATTQADIEKAAFETNKVVAGDTSNNFLYAGTYGTKTTNVWVQKVAESFQGKQTSLAWNTGKHNVDSKDYDDQMTLYLDRANRVTNTTFTWYLDQYGNIIGIGDAHAVNYGVITSIYSAQAQGETETTGAVKAVANVRYTDGTTGTVEINRFLMSWGGAAGNVPLVTDANNAAQGADYSALPGTTLTVTNTQLANANTAPTLGQDNTIELVPQFDTNLHTALTATAANPTFNRTAAGVAATGWLYISPSTTTNTNSHFANTTWDSFRILYDNLFEFSVADDNSVIATEVAGSYTNNGTASNFANTNVNFTRMANIAVNADGTLYKSLGYMALANAVVHDGVTQGTAAGTNYVYMDNSTQILVRLDGTGNRTAMTAYTLETLPGNVTIVNGSEVDWADIDGDGRADVVYIDRGTIPSTVTYGLFYYNGGVANWDGTTRTGTIAGYLNGEEKTISLNNSTLFNTIQNSQNYMGHLFALQFTGDVVSAVLNAKHTVNGVGPAAITNGWILSNGANASAVKVAAPFNGNGVAANATISTSFDGTPNATGTNFAVGTANGNPYTVTTEAVYYHDEPVGATLAAGQSQVVYTRTSLGDRIDVTGAGVDNYWLAPGCKIVGELSWLNTYECDVTMVYDAANANAVTEIYITMDPDITPDAPVNAITGADVVIPAAGQIDNAVTSGAANTVVFSNTQKTTVASLGLNPASKADQLIYFPYVSDAGTTTLEIRNAGTGALVYSESATVANHSLVAGTSGNKHCYVVDFTGTYPAPAGFGPGIPLTAGTTYSFRITGALNGVNGVLSQGTFTVG